MLPISAAATLASIYEATAHKPGNVHPEASFDDATCYSEFVQSAVVVGPILAHAGSWGVGKTVLMCVEQTRTAVRTNTNLGTVLLLAPLAAVPEGQSLADGIGQVLGQLNSEDTENVYEAIAASSAGGLGHTAQADVFDPAPPLSLVEAMQLAADRDLIAKQYVNNFATVFDCAARWIEAGVEEEWNLNEAIIFTHLRLMASYPDSLIRRKCNLKVAEEASERAASVMQAGRPREAAYNRALDDFDRWLRADGHRRNPGTTADLIAAGLFVLLREERLNLATIKW
jgi:triphosphoribosyl-dephospho-CoA synthase